MKSRHWSDHVCLCACIQLSLFICTLKPRAFSEKIASLLFADAGQRSFQMSIPDFLGIGLSLMKPYQHVDREWAARLSMGWDVHHSSLKPLMVSIPICDMTIHYLSKKKMQTCFPHTAIRHASHLDSLQCLLSSYATSKINQESSYCSHCWVNQLVRHIPGHTLLWLAQILVRCSHAHVGSERRSFELLVFFKGRI